MAHRDRDERSAQRRWRGNARRWNEDRYRYGQQGSMPGDDGQYRHDDRRLGRHGHAYGMPAEEDDSCHRHPHDEDRYRWHRDDDRRLGGMLHGEGYGGGPESGHEADRRRYFAGDRRHEGPYGRDTGRDWWDRASDELSSWFGDEQAGQRRQMDRARRFRGKGPRGYTRSDERTREDVNDRLTDDWRLDASDIEVIVKDCEVTLNGTVDSRYDKRLAEDLVDDVLGVRHVQNSLRVRQSTPTPGL